MVLKNYKELSDGEYEAFCNRLLDRSTSDDRFSSLEVRSNSLLEHLERFQEVLSRMPGSKEVTIERNDARAALTHVVDKMARDVENISDGNPEVVLAAGFEVRKEREVHFGALPSPVIKKISNDVKSGDVKIVLEPVKGAVNYAIEQSLDDGATWTNGNYSTASRIELSGYQAGTKVHFRICALGTRKRKSDKSEASLWIS